MTTPVDIVGRERQLLEIQWARVARASDLAPFRIEVCHLESWAARAVERLAVHAVLDEGWSYNRLGWDLLGVSRQAAAKKYGPLVQAELRRRMRLQQEDGAR